MMNCEIYNQKLLNSRINFNEEKYTDLRGKLFIKRLICKINALKKRKCKIEWKNQQWRTTPIDTGDTSALIPIPLLLDGCSIFNVPRAWAARLGFDDSGVESAIYNGFFSHSPHPTNNDSGVARLFFKISRYIYNLSMLGGKIPVPATRHLHTSLSKQIASYIEDEWRRFNQ